MNKLDGGVPGWRKRLGLTQREAAARLGVSGRVIRLWEADAPRPIAVLACQYVELLHTALKHLRRHWHDYEIAFMVEAWALLEEGWTAGVAVAGAAKGQDMPWRLDAARSERLRVAEHGGDRAGVARPLADAVSELVGDGTGTALVANLRGMYSETEMAAIEDALRRGVLEEEEGEGEG